MQTGANAGPQLEVEALTLSSARTWAVVLQRLVLDRRDDTLLAPDALALSTHRNWGAPETARRTPDTRAVPSLHGRLPPSLPSARSRPGAATGRLLDAVAETGPHDAYPHYGGEYEDYPRHGEPRMRNGASTARVQPVLGQPVMTARPATARELPGAGAAGCTRPRVR